MKLNRSLLLWQLRQARNTNALAFVAACLYVLFKREPLGGHPLWPWLFMAVHAGKIAFDLARPASTSFLYGRGFPRGTLWGHTTLAAFLSAMTAWLPAAMLIWTGARSALQAALWNPFYPLFASYDMPVPWIWALGYLTALPVFLYVYVRRAQPTRRNEAGDALALAYIAAAFVLTINAYSNGRLVQNIFIGAAVALTLTLLWGARRLQRTMEVR